MKKMVYKLTPLLMSTLLSTSFACNKKVNKIQGETSENFLSIEEVEEINPEVISITNKEGEEIELIEEESSKPVNSYNEFLMSLTKKPCVKTNARVNIRSESNTKCEKISQVDKGYVLELIGEENDFYKVIYNGNIGFVYKKYADVIESYITNNRFSVMLYVNDKIQMLDINTLEVVKEIPKNEVCEVFGETENAYLIRNNGSFGYISKKNVQALGANFVIIDISTQTLKLYKDNELILETFVVTGKDSSPTYCGLFSIREKEENVHWEEFNVTVSYWMPFNRGEGMHDAYWRIEFGGDIYKKNGSHGCVNLDPVITIIVFENVEIGTPVLVKK